MQIRTHTNLAQKAYIIYYSEVTKLCKSAKCFWVLTLPQCRVLPSKRLRSLKHVYCNTLNITKIQKNTRLYLKTYIQIHLEIIQNDPTISKMYTWAYIPISTLSINIIPNYSLALPFSLPPPKISLSSSSNFQQPQQLFVQFMVEQYRCNNLCVCNLCLLTLLSGFFPQ